MIAGQMRFGNQYAEVNRAVCIVITDYLLFGESGKSHTVFGMREKTEHFPFNDIMESCPVSRRTKAISCSVGYGFYLRKQ